MSGLRALETGRSSGMTDIASYVYLRIAVILVSAHNSKP